MTPQSSLSLPHWIQKRFLANRIPMGTRDSTAWGFATALNRARVPMDTRERAAIVFVGLMDQQEGDVFALDMVLEKIHRAADGKAWSPPQQKTVSGGFDARPVPFELPVFRAGDPQRLKWGWENHIAVVPVGRNSKGSLPKWKGLQTAPPTNDNWASWSNRAVWRNGNTGLLLGSEVPGMLRLYDIEVEHSEDFDRHPARDYFLEHTPVVLSRKSAHIIIMSDEVTPSTRSHDESGHLDGRFEFRGRGNYSLAPGSIHPASTPENPIIYQQVNILCDTILRVANVQAFVHHYFPGLFAPAKPVPTVDDSESPDETIDEARMRWKGKERKAAVNAIREQASFTFQSSPLFAALDTSNPLNLPTLTLREIQRILVQDTTFSYSKEETVALARLVCRRNDYTEQEHPTIRALLGCCEWKTGACPLHGDKCRCQMTCRSNWCALCGSKLTDRLAGGFYRAMGGGEGRRVMVFYQLLQAEQGQEKQAWAEGDLEAHSRQTVDALQALCRRITDRKAWAGREAIRASTYFLGDGWVLWRHTFAIEEHSPGESQELIKEFAGLGMHLEMQTVIQDGETWAKQLIELTTHALRGGSCKDKTLEAAEFVSVVRAVKRRHLNQTYGALRDIEDTAPASKPLVCDSPSDDPARPGEICGRKLVWRQDEPVALAEHAHKGVMVYCKAHRKLCALCRCGDHVT